jgi:hypothetical protein
MRGGLQEVAFIFFDAPILASALQQRNYIVAMPFIAN